MDQQQYTKQFQQCIKSQQTLILSTITAAGKPECSYAPYIRDEQGVFYIFVSELASHTQNMLTSGDVSILFIQAEQQASNIFARERVVFDCSIKEISKQDECYHKQMLIMEQSLGKTVALLKSLPDFHLLALTPVSGKYIAGFGQAFSINTETNSLQFES